jgi:hypothetical protein
MIVFNYGQISAVVRSGQLSQTDVITAGNPLVKIIEVATPSPESGEEA